MKENEISQTAESAGALPIAQANGVHRILVVEDDVNIRGLNTNVLTRAGYQVDAAEDGAVAWDTLLLNSYDLLITDNNMPKVSGVELLQKLHSARMALPAIMATGTMPQAFAQCPWLQPAAVLLKPYTRATLLAAVEAVLQRTEVHVQMG